MSHTVSGQTTNYTWDVAAGLPGVLQDGANTYVYGLDLTSATDGGSVQTYFLYDGLGSTVGLSDGAGNMVASYGYDVFGAIRTQTGSSPNYWLFTGEQRDGDTSFYYLRARYYDPAIGRFLSQDPVPSQNLYAYVGNNPVNYVDPSGLCHQHLGYDQVCRLAHQLSTQDDKEGSSFKGTKGGKTGHCKAGEVFDGQKCFRPRAICYGYTRDTCDYNDDSPWWEDTLIGIHENRGWLREWIEGQLEDECAVARIRLGSEAIVIVFTNGTTKTIEVVPRAVEGANNTVEAVKLYNAIKEVKENCG